MEQHFFIFQGLHTLRNGIWLKLWRTEQRNVKVTSHYNEGWKCTVKITNFRWKNTKIVLKILIFKIFAKSRRSSLLFYLQTNEWNLRISWKTITTVLPLQVEPFDPTTRSWADHAFEHGGRSSPLICGISVFLTFGRNKVDNFPTALLWMRNSVLEPSFVTDIQTRCDF